MSSGITDSMRFIEICYDGVCYSASFPSVELAEKWLAEMLIMLYRKNGLDRSSLVGVRGWDIS